MNLRWNGTHRRFEAEFSSDFQGDLEAVKAAGFKTTGAPEWIWFSQKAAPLTKLRENRPASGLTITAEAREQYTPLAALEAKNAEIKAQLAASNKALKKKLKEEKQEESTTKPLPMKMCEKGYVCFSRGDLPPVILVDYESPKSKTPIPDLKCFICGQPVYFYEKQDPPTCLWCEINVLDNSKDVC